MSERIDSRDVLDADAETRRPFRAVIIASFRRTGPNAWDDYELVLEEGEEVLEVQPGVTVMLERSGPELRLRRKGKVYRVRWMPSDDDPAALGDASASEQRAYLLAHYVRAYAEAAGIGAAAFIARKLGE